MRAAGHMGSDHVTVRNLRVVQVDAENHLLLVEGAVPGATNSYVVIRKAVAPKPEPKPQVEVRRRARSRARRGTAMTVDVVNAQNEKVGTLDLRDEVFGGRVKADLIWQRCATKRPGGVAARTRRRPARW